MIEQMMAVTIFVIMFALIVSEKIERQWASLSCGALMIVVVFGLCMRSANAMWSTLNFGEFTTLQFWYAGGVSENVSTGINWATILFIAGMMIMVEGMARTGFFAWLCLRIAKAVNYRVIPIFISFMLMSAILSMFIDSITVILFLAAITVELSHRLVFNPIPMILPEIFCASDNDVAARCAGDGDMDFRYGMEG